MIDVNKISNIYSIEKNLLNDIVSIIDDCYKLIAEESTQLKVATIETNKLLSYITFLGESYSIMSYDECMENIRKTLVAELKKRIENGSISDVNIYNGLAAAAFSVKVMSINTGNYLNFSMQLDSYLIKKTFEKVKMLKSINYCRSDFYDFIMGISGLIPYLSIFCDVKEAQPVIKDSLEYLSGLIGNNISNNISIPKCYIKNKHLLTLEDKKMFPNGYFNLGLSHGITGILIAFSVAEIFKLTIPNHLEYISTMVAEFKKLEYLVDDISYWPDILNIYEYSKISFKKSKKRNSWCYGNIGILCGLYQAAIALKDTEQKNDINKKIIKLTELNNNEHKYSSIIICHGVSGLLLFYHWYNKYTKSTLLRPNIIKLLISIVDFYKANGYSAFLDKDINGNTRDTFAIIDGSLGCILTLLSFIKEETHFQKCLGFFNYVK